MIVACLVMRRLPFVLSAILAVLACCSVVRGVRAAETRRTTGTGTKTSTGCRRWCLCCVLFAALTLIMIASYRPSPEARAGHELRSTGIVTSIFLALAAMVSVAYSLISLMGSGAVRRATAHVAATGLGFELPVLLGQVIPFGRRDRRAVVRRVDRAAATRSGAAAASAFLCILTAAVDLAMFYASRTTRRPDMNQVVSYAVGALLSRPSSPPSRQ